MMESLQLLFEVMPDIVLFLDFADERVLAANQAACSAYGYTRAEMIGLDAHRLRPAIGPLPLRTIFEQAAAGPFRTASTALRKDGTTFPIEASVWCTHLDERKIVVCIVHDISARRALEKELAESHEQATLASRMKSEFVATISHELRTPLHGVVGMTDLLRRTALDSEQRPLADSIAQSAQTLLTVVTDILDFSKLETGNLALEIAEFSPVSLLESTGRLLAIDASRKDLSLMTYIDPALPAALMGDVRRLRQVLVNLVGNAIKFTDKGSVSLSLALQQADERSVTLRCSVRDTGIGMPQSALDKLSEPFTQLDASSTRTHGGTGLGLSISRRLIEHMGGEFGGTSALGEGSTFWFTLLLLRAPSKQRDSVGEAASAMTDLARLRILIVDDDVGARIILGRYLTSWGVQSEGVESARAALVKLRAAAAQGRPYDVALVDFVMPETDGLALARAIKEDAAINETRLVLISAHDRLMREAAVEDVAFGAYVTKPIRQSDLLNAVITVVSREAGAQATAPRATAAPAAPQEMAARVPGGDALPLLLAEDHPINQRLAMLQLQELGLTVEIVGDGAQAVEAVRTKRYALVLMDCHMPVLDGLAATRAIRNNEATTGQRIPIIAMTANAMEGDREGCLAAGMDDYIAKPITTEGLAKVLERWLPRHVFS